MNRGLVKGTPEQWKRFDELRYAIHDIEVMPRKATEDDCKKLKEYRRELNLLKYDLGLLVCC